MNKNLKTDSAILRLAHPLRCIAAQADGQSAVLEFLGPEVCNNIQEAFRQDRLSSEIVIDLLRNPANRRLSQLLNASSRSEGGTEVGNAMSFLMFLRHTWHPQPYFVIDDSLVEMMENTDIADDVTVDMVNVPYSRFYIEFGKSRTCSLRVPNVISGEHVLEGGYVERGINKSLGDGLSIVLTGSPVGKAHAMDDATHSLFLPLADQARTVKDAMALTFNMSKAIAIESGYRMTPDSFIQPVFESVLFLLKTLLYINLPDARKELHKEKTEWLKSVSSLQSTAKKAKAAKRGRALVDHIRISAPLPVPDTVPQAGITRTTKQHWRRGHYRAQAHGPQHSLRKVIFIKPVLVHGEVTNSLVPQYKVS